MKLTNEKNFILHTPLYSAATTLITNSIIQGFMLENGLPEQTVMFYLSTVQAVQVCVMFLFSSLVDKLKKVMQLYSFAILFQITMLLALIPICIFPGLSVTAKTIILFSAGILTNIDQAILSITAIKAPYFFLDMRRIGNIQGISSALCGVVGVIVSALLLFFTGRFEYNSTMLVFFITGIALILISFLIIKKIKATPPSLPQNSEEKKRISILKYKPFYLLIIPNLLRGFNSGIFVSTMTIGFTLGITDKSSSATLTLIMQGAYILGNYVFSRISAPRRNVKITFLSGLSLIFLMPLMMSGNIALFYGMYFLAAVSISFIDIAIPCTVVEIVDFECMGQYSSYRMLLHTLGITISYLVALPLIQLLGGVGTMIFSASCQLIAGLSYFLLERSIYKKQI